MSGNLKNLKKGARVIIQFEAEETYVDGEMKRPCVNENWVCLGMNEEQIVFTQPGGYGTIDVYVHNKNVRVKEGRLIASGKVCFTKDIYGNSHNHQEKSKLLKLAGFRLSSTYGGGGF